MAIASSSCGSVSQRQALDEVGAQEGEQDVAAAEQHRADLERRTGTAAASPNGAAAERRPRRRRAPRRPAQQQRQRRARRTRAAPRATRRRTQPGRAEHDELVDAGEPPRPRAHQRRRAARVFTAVRPRPPQRLDDDGDDHRLDAVEQPADLRERAEAHVGPRERADDQRRGQDEAGAGDDSPGQPARRWPMWIAISVEFGRG